MDNMTRLNCFRAINNCWEPERDLQLQNHFIHYHCVFDRVDMTMTARNMRLRRWWIETMKQGQIDRCSRSIIKLMRDQILIFFQASGKHEIFLTSFRQAECSLKWWNYGKIKSIFIESTLIWWIVEKNIEFLYCQIKKWLETCV